MKSYDAIVIGLGGMGSAALHHLASRGLRVLGIEQFGIAHERGSSHGRTRIIRKAYFEHPDYVPLLHRAYALWDALQAEHGERLFERVGLLLVGRADGAVISGVRRSAAEHKLDICTVPGDELRTRFPGFSFADGMEALHERDAGFLRVERCVAAHIAVAQARTAELALNTSVREWRAEGAGVVVRTDNDEFSAARLVICGGPWSARLLADLRLPLEVRRKVQLWFACDDPRYRVEAGFPVFCYDLGDRFFYGFPVIENGQMKIAEHSGREVVADADSLDRDLHEADVRRVGAFVSQHLPGVRSDVLAHSVCMYTMTPDEHFVIDRHPACPQVAFAAGFSGHGFKFSTVVGEILADFSTQGRTNLPAGFLAAGRASLRAGSVTP